MKGEFKWDQLLLKSDFQCSRSHGLVGNQNLELSFGKCAM